jgi:hypothetical protein
MALKIIASVQEDDGDVTSFQCSGIGGLRDTIAGLISIYSRITGVDFSRQLTPDQARQMALETLARAERERIEQRET